MGTTRAKFMQHKNHMEQTLIMTILMEWSLEQVITGKHRHVAAGFGNSQLVRAS